MRPAGSLLRRVLGLGWGAVVIVASLAVGIGLNGAVYACFRAAFVRPYAFDRGHRLVEICQQERGYSGGDCVDSRADLQDLRQASRSYAAVTAYRLYLTSLSLGRGEQEVQVTEADQSFVVVTGIRPHIGRMFVREDFDYGAPPVCLLSDALWRRIFAGDPHVIGHSIHLGARDVRIVGIMPPEFAFPFNSPAFGAKGTGLWMPLPDGSAERAQRNVRAAARLKNNVGVRQAQAETSAVAADLAKRYAEDKEYTFELHRLDYDLDEQFGKTAEIVGVITALIFLLAVLNVNGVFLAEHFRRWPEWRVRAVLGATRWQLLRPYLAVSLVLAGAGGIMAALVAAVFLRTATAFVAGRLPHLDEAALDWRVLAFIAAVSGAAGLLCGIWPSVAAGLRAGRAAALTPYQGDSELTTRTATRARWILVTAQAGGAMALLSLAGMLLMHTRAAVTTDVGFRMDHLVNFTWTASKPSWSEIEHLRANLEAIPGVESVAFSRNTPLAGDFVAKFRLPATGSPDPGPEYPAYFNSVSGDYFNVLGIPLKAGRSFSEPENHKAGNPEVVVNEAFVRRFSPTVPVLGRRICLIQGDGPACKWGQIVGVASDVRDSGIFDPPDPAFYLPWEQNAQPALANLCLRTRIAPEAILGAVRRAVSRTSPTSHAFFIETVENLAREQVSSGIVILYGAAVAAAAAVLLALGGLYGTLSHAVNQSRREIGIRIAVGATPSVVAWHFAWHAGKWLTLGLALGVFSAIAMNQSARAGVYGLPALKPWVLAAAGTVLAAVSVPAVLLPVVEAVRLDPAAVLRYE
jgi:predicted permease